uniref:Uncharacterized protein n=1 Tax=Rhizophora mucronata TaxID=61149 RepID=A0A2P2NY55_RHIMU
MLWALQFLWLLHVQIKQESCKADGGSG